MAYPNLHSIGHTFYCGSVSPSEEIANRAKMMTWDIVCVTFGLRLFWASYHTTTVHYKFSQAPHSTLLLPFELGLVTNWGVVRDLNMETLTPQIRIIPQHIYLKLISCIQCPNIMKYWLGIVNVQASFAQCTPRTRWLSPLYTNSGIRFPYTWEWQSPSLQFKQLLPILLLVKQALCLVGHFGEWSIFWSHLFHHETKQFIWVTQFKWSQ